MPVRLRRATPTDLADALAARDAGTLDRAGEKLLVKHFLAVLSEIAPGASVEVRVPPHAAVQVIPGVRHTRGTPPAVVETDPDTWLDVATGRQTWAEAVASGSVRASGERTDLGHLLPLTTR